MTKIRSTKSALISSVIALLLCFTMLLGSTFAWFTDSVTSANNIIKSGNLDIELYHTDDIDTHEKVGSNTVLFDDIALWEPGAVVYETFEVVNEGSLALKYQLSVNVTNANANANGNTLADVLKVGVIKGGATATDDRAALIAEVEDEEWTALTSFTKTGNLINKDDKDVYTVVIYWEPSENDNDYNMNNGKGEPLTIDIGVTLFATQYSSESDSFNENYDELAGLPWTGKTEAVPEAVDGVITITNAEQFAGFAAAVNSGNTYSGKTIKLAADINLGNRLWTPIGQTGSTQFVGSFDGNGHTIYNLNIDNTANTSQYGAAGLFGWVEHHSGSNSIKDLTIDGVTINSHRYSGAIAGWINIPVTNCTVKNVTINCSYYNDDTDGTKVGALVGYADNGSELTNNTVDTAILNAFGDVGGLAGVAQTSVSVTGNTLKNVVINYVSVTKSNPGEIVSTRVAPVMGTNTVENVTMKRSINVTSTALLNKELAGLSGDALSTAAILSNCNEPDAIINLPTDYTGILTIKDSTIKSVQAAGNANIVIVGDVVVNANGSGVATVAETVTTFDGSAITANGTLTISGTGNLTAIATDVKAAFGIGGMNVSKLNISNVHIVKATGAGVDSKIGNNYGKQDFEGAPAIGSGYTGAEITLNNVTVDEALGGSKGAGIGARYHTGVTINIVDSVIKNVVGGSSSAGIGGSRMTKYESGDLQNVTINIANSTVNATGGDFGAGIGSGYNTYCSGVTPTPVIAVTIDADSVITAQGGWLGAGIGTGHNAIGFVGNIACDTSNVKAGNSEDPSWCCWGNPCTTAENVGLGVLSIKNFPNVFGTYVTNAEELAQKVSNGITELYLADGEYDVYGCGGQTLTINGTKDVVLTIVGTGSENGGQSDYGFDGSTVTFNGVTIRSNNNTYAGYVRMSGTYNNCHFENTYCLYKDSTFTDCTFNISGDQYNIWTWGAPEATFNNCTFNSDGKALLLYGTANTKLTLNDCTFNDKGGLTDLKAAVEIGNDYGKSYELIVNNTVVNGYEINDKGINTGTTLWGNKNSMSKDKLNVVVDGVDVY